VNIKKQVILRLKDHFFVNIYKEGDTQIKKNEKSA